jgi:hypothetical protein
MIAPRKSERKRKKRVVQLCGGPADGMKIRVPNYYRSGCQIIIELHGPPESNGLPLVYQARRGNIGKADYLPWQWASVEGPR